MVAELFVANSKQTKSQDYYLAIRNLFFPLRRPNGHFLGATKICQ
jgi:hypothetical protein